MKTMKINADDFLGFVWDGCHKIYLIESDEDWKQCDTYSRTEMRPMDELPAVWAKSCPLRFISTYASLATIIPQGAPITKIEIIRGANK